MAPCTTYVRTDSVDFDITVGDITYQINVLIPVFPTGVPDRDEVFVARLDINIPLSGELLTEASHVVCVYVDEHYPKWENVL